MNGIEEAAKEEKHKKKSFEKKQTIKLPPKMQGIKD